jgi:hypothetical protein
MATFNSLWHRVFTAIEHEGLHSYIGQSNLFLLSTWDPKDHDRNFHELRRWNWDREVRPILSASLQHDGEFVHAWADFLHFCNDETFFNLTWKSIPSRNPLDRQRVLETGIYPMRQPSCTPWAGRAEEELDWSDFWYIQLRYADHPEESWRFTRAERLFQLASSQRLAWPTLLEDQAKIVEFFFERPTTPLSFLAEAPKHWNAAVVEHKHYLRYANDLGFWDSSSVLFIGQCPFDWWVLGQLLAMRRLRELAITDMWFHVQKILTALYREPSYWTSPSLEFRTLITGILHFFPGYRTPDYGLSKYALECVPILSLIEDFSFYDVVCRAWQQGHTSIELPSPMISLGSIVGSS